MVYGATLEAYSFINAMLQNGVSGDQILFVQPPVDVVSCFNNEKIEKLIHNVLKEKGIQLFDYKGAIDVFELHCIYYENLRLP